MPDNFFNWITVVGVIATCIGTIVAIVQAKKASKASKASKVSADQSQQHANIAKKSAETAKQILKGTIDRRELDRDAQRLKNIRDILSEQYTRNYNPRGSKLDKKLSELNHLLNEFSGQTIFINYQTQIDEIQNYILKINVSKISNSIEVEVQGLVTKLNQLLRLIDGAIKDGE